MASRSNRGTLKAYRIGTLKYPIYDGTGASIRGGRWNSPGNAVIYAALSLASAMLERLIQTSGAKPPSDHWIEITIPASVSVERLDEARLAGWDAEDRKASSAFGDRWLAEARSAVLVVPAMTGRPVERNLLISPRHAQVAAITGGKPRPVIWDDRIFGKPPA